MDGQCTLQLPVSQCKLQFPVCQCKLQFPVCHWDIPGKIIHRSSLIFPPSLWLYKKKVLYINRDCIQSCVAVLRTTSRILWGQSPIDPLCLFSPLKCLWCLWECHNSFNSNPVPPFPITITKVLPSNIFKYVTRIGSHLKCGWSIYGKGQKTLLGEGQVAKVDIQGAKI